ncbi:unnamed protein product [Triticum turgidum subsp. durum]|uniref:RING-CH-type domain-containing protein n=1 Tax=Triticum turgidum subsp. durum TaxID=4567 RepID=A0A9R0WAR5_TRITD|nr:unnamed protein product [Triticum turgidum subsp. durum]
MEEEKARGLSSAASSLIPPTSPEIDLEAGAGDQLQCRICLETDGRDFIAPCKCKGTSKYVHRDCLDHWRAVKVGALIPLMPWCYRGAPKRCDCVMDPPRVTPVVS